MPPDPRISEVANLRGSSKSQQPHFFGRLTFPELVTAWLLNFPRGLRRRAGQVHHCRKQQQARPAVPSLGPESTGLEKRRFRCWMAKQHQHHTEIPQGGLQWCRRLDNIGLGRLGSSHQLSGFPLQRTSLEEGCTFGCFHLMTWLTDLFTARSELDSTGTSRTLLSCAQVAE